MLGDMDLMQCGKDAPSMRRLSIQLSRSSQDSDSNAKDIPNLRRVSTSSVSSTRSSMSQDGVLSPTFSSSMPNSFYLDRVTSLLGRASSLPMNGAGTALPSIPSPTRGAPATTMASSPTRPLQMVHSTPADTIDSGRASALIRSLSKGMDSFR
jgi:hypothetical protein